jgi:hypothetical protein
MSSIRKALVVIGISVCIIATLHSQTTVSETPVPPTTPAAEIETSPGIPTPTDIGTAGSETAAKPEKIDKTGIPYIGKITGDRVYIRSGPAQVYYDVGHLNKGQLVVVRDERRGVSNWAKIDPTRQCFSWISKKYVELVGTASITEETVPAQSIPPAVSIEPTKAIGTTTPITSSSTEPGAITESPTIIQSPVVTSTTEEIKSVTPPVTAEKTVVPTPVSRLGSFIGKQVLLGRVTGNYIRVRAGSVKVPPANANQVQLRLNTGAEVQIIGERDDYYKIICPPGCSFWVSLDYVERVGPATAEIVEKMLKLRSASVPGGVKVETVLDKDRQEYREIGKLLNVERSKPISQQDYTEVRTRLTALTQDMKSPSLKAMAQSLERQLVRCEMGVNLWKMSKRQDDNLQATLAKIDEELELLVAVNNPPNKGIEDLVVKGRLGKSAVFTTPNKNQRFLVLDDNEKIIYYAVADKEGIDLSQWIDKKVSLAGQPEYDAFSKIRILKVTSLVELPPEK